MRPLSALVTCLVAAGCFPPRHDVVGRACDATHPCPDGLLCSPAQVCSRDDSGSADGGGGPPNAVSNGGFESSTAGWRASDDNTGGIEVSQAMVRTGAFALRAFATAPSLERFGVTLSPGATSVADGDLWCAEAWVQRGTASGVIDLVLRSWSGTSWRDSGTPLVPTGDAWQRAAGQIQASAPFTEAVNLRVVTDGASGTQFFVDDVRLWRATTGSCN